ncbi:flippase kinase 1-like isoform X3 [Varroa destructor]|uniref:mitogen-activated protein kinase kinase n=1 Tax=Varroa destructor TaxID=109461 RepID=A0A7M7KJQ0_VARDE|nr:flippase kinase 1-like isoform X3 [Varroa destructor]
MDVLALSDDANSELSDYTKVATSPWPLSQDHKPALKKCVPYHNRVSRERVRFCSVPTVEGQIPAESLRDSSGTSPGSVRTTRSPISLSLYRNADGTIFPKSSALRLTTHRLTVESDGKEDSRSPRSPSSPSASTSRHNSFAMVAENGDNSFDGRTVSQDCSSPKGGGRHIQTRELAPSEKIGDAELRREVSDFIRFAKRGNISNGKKKNQLALEGPKEPSLSEVTSSVQGFAATTWHHIMRGMRTLVGIVFRHRKDSHFNTADLSTMWVNPSNAKDFEITPGCLQMRHKIGAGSYGVVYLVEHKKTWARYAIKCVRKRSGRKQASFLKRSETEFHVWRETGSHPNIISLIAAFQTRSAFCFVMDFVSTGSLSLLLSRQDKPLREDEIKRMASQLAHALYTVHRLGFLHRDVSCSNVLVTAKHNVLLIDFGSSVIGNTATSRAGTLAYMAPEQDGVLDPELTGGLMESSFSPFSKEPHLCTFMPIGVR